MRRCATVVVLAALVTAGGCGEEPGEPSPSTPFVEVTLRDSAGVRIIEHGPLGAPPNVRVRGREDTLFAAARPTRSGSPGGGAAPDGPARPERGVLLGDGRAAVIDATTQDVWILERGSRPRRLTGREGSPGVTRVGGLMTRGDTLLVYDGPAGALLRFGGPGPALVGTRDVPDPGGGSRSLLHVGDGRFALVSVGDPPTPAGRRSVRLEADVAWWFDDRPDTLIHVQTWPGRSWYSIGSALGLLPYGPDTWFAAGAGRLAVGESSRAEVVLLDVERQEIRLIRWAGLEELPRRVVDAYVDRLLLTVPEVARSRMRTLMESVPFPAVYPAFQELILVEGRTDPAAAGESGRATPSEPGAEGPRDGELWVGEFVGTLVELGPGALRPAQGWRIFDLEGRFIGTFRTEEGERLLDVTAGGRALVAVVDPSGETDVVMVRLRPTADRGG